MKAFRQTWLIVLLIAGMAVTAGSGSVAAKSKFPDRPLTLVVPWSAGGGTDRIARMLAISLEEQLGQSVNVVNRPGGGGVVGHMAGARARSDGYTLVLSTIELVSYQSLNLADVSYEDFDAIALVNRDPFVIAVGADSPYQTVSNFVNAVRNDPGQISISGAGYGSSNHVGVIGWLTALGLPSDALRYVPSQGGSAGAVQEVIAGGIDAVITSLAELTPMIEAGRLRPLVIMGEEGTLSIPTAKEAQGIDWTFGPWRGLVVPMGVPADVLDTLRDAAQKAVQSETFTTPMVNSGFSVVYKDPDGFRTIMKNDRALFEDILTSL